MEAEKFLFDLKNERPSEGVFRFIDALSDFDPPSKRNITNEFVLNMVEIVEDPSENPLEVLTEYFLDYLMFNSVAKREAVTMVGLGSLPMSYLPHMSPRWSYFVQNSILAKKLQNSWMMSARSPLAPAGNCAGIHVHAEIETLPEFLFASRELVDKFNLGLMLTPLIALSSSPYSFGRHEAFSMRGEDYYHKIYGDFPLNGGLPPVMNTSEEVLNFFKEASLNWYKEGVSIGIPEDGLLKILRKKGANWNPVRWNRVHNTIELRCLDSDRIDFDCGKFILICGAMKRSDLKGEHLKCRALNSKSSLEEIVENAFTVRDGWVDILPTEAIQEIFKRAVLNGSQDPLVKKYLRKIFSFAEPGTQAEALPILKILQEAFENDQTTAHLLLKKTNGAPTIDGATANTLLKSAVSEEKRIMKDFLKLFPDASSRFTRLIDSIK